MKVVKDVLIIAWMRCYPDIRRNPFILFVIMMFSGAPLLFMQLFGGAGMLVHGFIGAIISMVGFIGLASAIQDIAWDRYVKIREMIVAMPVHPISYVMGVALSSLLFSAPGAAFFITIAIWQGAFTVAAIIWIVPALLLCWLSLTAIGFTIATYLQKASLYLLNAISLMLSFVFAFMLPVFYPKEILGNFAWIAFLAPTSITASLFRIYIGSPSLYGDIFAHWIILLAITIASFILLSMKYRWREV